MNQPQHNKTSERIRKALKLLGFVREDTPETIYNDHEEQMEANFDRLFKEKEEK